MHTYNSLVICKDKTLNWGTSVNAHIENLNPDHVFLNFSYVHIYFFIVTSSLSLVLLSRSCCNEKQFPPGDQ